jgi:hypothetical protein
MQFVDKYDSFGYEFNTVASSCKGLITISDATTWNFQMMPGELPLTKGVWKWDLETVDSDGITLTLLSGTIKIIDDITVSNR